VAVAAPAEVTALYRARLSTATAGLLLRVGGAWQALFDPTDPSASLARIGTTVGTWVTGAQAAAVAETLTYLRALYAADTGLPLAAVGPFTSPGGLVGSAANGATVMALTGQAPAVYSARKGSGWSDSAAGLSSLSWLNRVAASEPYRVANTATMANAADDDRFTGRVVRITRAGCCDFCADIADRGYIPANAGFAAHHNCRCTPSPEISAHALSRRSRRRAMEAEERATAREASEQAQAPTGASRADTVPFTGFEKVSKANATLTRDVIRRNLEGIRPTSPTGYARCASPILGTTFSTRHVPSPAMAWYRDAHRNVTIRQSSFGSKGTAVVRRNQQVDRITGLSRFVGTAQYRQGIEYVTTHEMGHFLDHQLTDPQRLELAQVIERTAPSNRADQPAHDRGASAARQVSAYSMESRAELIAEAWAEYKLSPRPRAMAQAIGDTLMRFLR
jgi:hypothetical protein